MPVPSWLVYARQHYSKPDNYDLECEVKDAKEVDTEMSRLISALREIANDPGGYPAEEAFSEIREIARKALEDPQ